MKIKKFNESHEEEIDTEYITFCFADLIDEGAELNEKEFITPYGNRKCIEFSFDIKMGVNLGDTGRGDREFISRRNKLSNYIDNQNYNNTLLQKVKIAFTQLSDEYPNYKLYPVIVGNKLEVRIYPSN